MISFKDFAPEQTSPPQLFVAATFEAFQSAVQRANDWITAADIQVINIETVVLPNFHLQHEDGSTDPSLMANAATSWHQFVRVWYRS